MNIQKYTWLLLLQVAALPLLGQIPSEIRPKLQGLLPLETLRESPVYFGSGHLKPGSAADIPVIVEVSNVETFAAIENLGGRINTRDGYLATVQLPKKSLAAVTALPGVLSLEYNKVFPQTDQVRQHTRADLVQQGVSPLPQGYNGQGIIVGVVDAGIDFRHPDFRDPADPSKSRILAIWDQNATNGTPPTGFSYGSFWTKSQIEAEFAPNPPNLIAPGDNDFIAPGHGTHVAGIAAGNAGMAPGADLVVVVANFSFNGIIDGVKFARDFAHNAGKPCAVNLSIGSSVTNHEGNTNMPKLINNLLTGTEGFSVIAAAGNDGNNNGHWGGFQLKNDTAMMFTGTSGRVTAYFRVPKIYGDSLWFSVGADSAHFNLAQLSFEGGTQFLGATPWKKVGALTDYTQFFIRPGGDTAGVVQILWQSASGLNYYPFIVDIYDFQNQGQWLERPDMMDVFRFMFRGSGSFHGWLEGQPFFVVANPGDLGLPAEYFVPSDNNFGIIAPADGKNIVAAGAYVNRPSWTDVTGQTHFIQTPQATGELADFSSHGPTFDGRQKPEICAPGKHVISAYPTFWNELSMPLAFANGGNPLWMFTGDTIHASYSGTSMAAPAVTGCVALLLEAKPDLDFSEIMALITSTARTDAFTDASGPLPNGLFGYGKMDIFSAVMAALGLSETDSPLDSPDLRVFPNPANDHLTAVFENPGNGTFSLFRADGGRVVEINTNNEYWLEVPTSGLPAGIYCWKWAAASGAVSGKVLVVH